MGRMRTAVFFCLSHPHLLEDQIMSTLNPSDIENITVIKDAAAASLYGSRIALPIPQTEMDANPNMV